jgi:hypothetical protein
MTKFKISHFLCVVYELFPQTIWDEKPGFLFPNLMQNQAKEMAYKQMEVKVVDNSDAFFFYYWIQHTFNHFAKCFKCVARLTLNCGTGLVEEANSYGAPSDTQELGLNCKLSKQEEWTFSPVPSVHLAAASVGPPRPFPWLLTNCVLANSIFMKFCWKLLVWNGYFFSVK